LKFLLEVFYLTCADFDFWPFLDEEEVEGASSSFSVDVQLLGSLITH
jgi:hypothetical protein